MTNMLEELWYGNIGPCSRAAERRDKQNPNLSLLNKTYKEFSNTLDDSQKKVFEDFKEKLDDIILNFERESFKDGYKIATRLILSCFETDTAIFDDIM